MVNLIPWTNRRRDLGGTGMATSYRSGIDRLFENLLSGFENVHQSILGFPALELSDTDNEIVITAEVPGMDPDDIEVTVSGNQLVICGEKKNEREEQHEGYHRSERQYGFFRRMLDLPQDVDPQKIDARYNNGILELHIPKTEDSHPRRIAVQKGGSESGSERGGRGSREGSGLNLRETPEPGASRPGNRGMSGSAASSPPRSAGPTQPSPYQPGNAQRNRS